MNAPSLPSPPAKSGLRTSAESSEQTLANLLGWMEQGGARFARVNIVRQEDGERSVLARSDIEKGEVVLSIPRTHLFSLERAKASDIGRRIQSELQTDNDFLYLASWLLEEKHRGGDSFWKPFVDSLPEAYPHVPMFFSEGERAFLQGSQLPRLVEVQTQAFQQEYAQLREKLPEYARFTFEEFVWARISLYSRLFALKGALQGPSLVPLSDMFNHRQPPDVLWATSEDGQSFQMIAQRAVAAGEELHTHYGHKSSDVFLLHSGFVPDGNEENDEVYLSVGLPPGDPLASVKQQMFGLASPTAKNPFKVSRQAKYLASWSVFSFLRMANASPDEFIALSGRLNSGALTVAPLSVACEQRVLEALARACEERLKAFPTPLDEDERLLREGPLSPNERSGVLLRRQEKRLLRDYLELTRTGRAVLRQPREELEQLAARPESPWGWFDGYVRNDLLGLRKRAG
ncbi:MAG: SET domain-containing histone-lysine N-methyltransferase [Cystobacter sp.]